MDLAHSDLDVDPAASLWHAWRVDGHPQSRERLMVHYQRFARVLASRLYRQHPYRVVEFGDYVQYANVGLIEAMERFDLGAGVRFEAYAARRIRGAILDGIRRSSDVQEQISARRRIAMERVEALAPEPANGDIETLFARLADVAVGLAVGLVLEGTGMFQGGEDEAAADRPYQSLELAQLGQRIRELVANLPAPQREVLVGHYLQQRSFAEVAEQMQLSRGRIAQLHKEALARLRRLLDRQGVTSLSC